MGPAPTGRRGPGTTPGNGMQGAVPGGFAPAAVEGGEPIILAVRSNGKVHIWFGSDQQMESQGSPSPKPPPKKKRVKSQAPKDKAKRRDRLLDDQDVQELLQEERAAYSRAMFDVDKALFWRQ